MRVRRKKDAAPPGGFTLIELLVVIAILVVLAAMLSPAAKTARAKGHDAACRSNLRQYYAAFLQYAGDNDGLFPGYLNPPSPGAACNGSTWVIWQTRLVNGGYLPRATNSTANRGLVVRGLDCPANVNAYYPLPPNNTTFKNSNPDYLYNAEMGHDASCNAAAGGPRPLMRLSSAASLSGKAVLFEGGQQYGWQPYRCGYAISGWPGYFDPNLVTYSIADPHDNRSNALFMDGHVESFARGKMDWRIAALTQL